MKLLIKILLLSLLSFTFTYANDIKNLIEKANQGDMNAQIRLGERYRAGDGVEQNFETSVEWFRLAAEKGHPEAQVDLGWMYQYGKGVEQNNSEAFRLYLLSANQNYIPAQYNLGVMYSQGIGVTQDDIEAAKWFAKACENGIKKSCDAYKH